MSDVYSKSIFNTSRLILLVGISLFYGITARSNNLPPVPQMRWVTAQVTQVLGLAPNALLTNPVAETDAAPVELRLPGQEQPGLIAFSFDIAPRITVIRVIDRQGNMVHEWLPRWNHIWPKGEGNFVERPVGSTFLHGLEILSDGSLVANFEVQSTFRMDVCGDLVWKLDNQGHHSVTLASDNTLWVSAEDHIQNEPTGIIAHRAPYRSYLLQQIDLDGNVLRTINLAELLLKNGLDGLLLARAVTGPHVWTNGDTLHLNDVEAFPSGVESAVFNAGDLIVSLRNLNTLLGVDPITEEIKWSFIGRTVRQHDPDFTRDGTISVYDNQTHLGSDETQKPVSRIIEIDPETGEHWTVLGAQSDRPFFSRITGSHERLANGNILVVASQEGRLLEYTAAGRLVWRYDARQSPMRNGRTYNALILPAFMDAAFFENEKRRCKS